MKSVIKKTLVVFCVLSVIFSIYFQGVYALSRGEDAYKKLLTAINNLAGGTTAENAPEVAQSAMFICQNQEAVTEFLDDVMNNYPELRGYLNIDSSGNIDERYSSEAVYKIGYMMESNMMYLNDVMNGEAENMNADNFLNSYANVDSPKNASSDFHHRQDNNEWYKELTYEFANTNRDALDEYREYLEHRVCGDEQSSMFMAAMNGYIDNNYITFDRSKGIPENLTDSNGNKVEVEVNVGGRTITGTTSEQITQTIIETEHEMIEVVPVGERQEEVEELVEKYGDTGGGSSSGTFVDFVASFNFDEILKMAQEFFVKAWGSKEFINAEGITRGFINMIFQIGNLVILIAMVLTGLRYVFSGVGGKTSIKESLVNMAAGIILFYLAQGLYDMIEEIISTTIKGASTFESVEKMAFGNVAFIVKMLTLVAMAGIGLRYMMADSVKKANVMKEMLPVLIGLVVIFCATSLIQFVTDTTSQMLDIEKTELSEVKEIDQSEVDGTVLSASQRIFGIVELLVQMFSVVIVVYTGVTYMISPADKRADIKGKTIIMIIGASLIFAAVSIIQVVAQSGNNILS